MCTEKISFLELVLFYNITDNKFTLKLFGFEDNLNVILKIPQHFISIVFLNLYKTKNYFIEDCGRGSSGSSRMQKRICSRHTGATLEAPRMLCGITFLHLGL